MTIRILLVEDGPSTVELVEFALASEGFQMTWRTLAGDAEAELPRKAYDLIAPGIGLMTWRTLAGDAEAELPRKAYDLIAPGIGLPEGCGSETRSARIP